MTRSSRREELRADPQDLIHILDDSINDGFAWCGWAPTGLKKTESSAATCLFCIVKAAKYRGLE